MKHVRQELSKQDLQDLLKKLLHQNGLCLLIYPQGSNTSLLTALAETIHANEQTLHQKISEKLEQDYRHMTLPRRLSFIYDDPTIIDDFKKHPQIVKFSKITLQLFSSSTERRLNLYSLSSNSDGQYNLTCVIINENGYKDSINIARISNKYYNIQERNLDSRNELSLEDVFKNSHPIDSDELIQTFKAEVPEHLSQKIIVDKEIVSHDVTVTNQIKSSGKIGDAEQIDVSLKRGKSSMPYKQFESLTNKNVENDGVSLGDKIQLREDAKLINQCSSGLENNFESYHQNNHMMAPGVMTPQQMQMYYLYYQSSLYQQGNSQTFINYQQPAHSISPTINPVYKPIATPIAVATQPVQPINNFYNQPYFGQIQTIETIQNSENNRFAGRLKFFDEARNYGFIIMDADASDIFVHYDDLQKAGISKQVIKTFKNQMYLQIRFSFKVMDYFGKYKKSRKAVELIIIGDGLSNILGASYPLPE